MHPKIYFMGCTSDPVIGLISLYQIMASPTKNTPVNLFPIWTFLLFHKTCCKNKMVPFRKKYSEMT